MLTDRASLLAELEACSHGLDEDYHCLRFPYVEGRNVWNALSPVCDRCGKNLGEILAQYRTVVPLLLRRMLAIESVIKSTTECDEDGTPVFSDRSAVDEIQAIIEGEREAAKAELAERFTAAQVTEIIQKANTQIRQEMNYAIERAETLEDELAEAREHLEQHHCGGLGVDHDKVTHEQLTQARREGAREELKVIVGQVERMNRTPLSLAVDVLTWLHERAALARKDKKP